MKILALKSNVIAFAARYDELAGWGFVFSSGMSKRQLGLCIFPAMSIHYNAPVLEVNPLGTCFKILLHEIAHAIADARYGHREHGPQFKQVCAELGIGAEAFLNVRYPKTGPVYHCDNCGWKDWSYSRRSRKAVKCICDNEMHYYKN